MKMLTYIDAVPSDHKLLSTTAWESKRSWGYSDDVMDLVGPELEISESYIAKNKVVKVFHEGRFIGFFAVKTVKYKDAEIDHFWLIPSKQRQGYGREIFKHLLSYLKTQACRKVTIIAEPNAKGFYHKMGGRVSGKYQTKIPGRVLDIYEFDV